MMAPLRQPVTRRRRVMARVSTPAMPITCQEKGVSVLLVRHVLASEQQLPRLLPGPS